MHRTEWIKRLHSVGHVRNDSYAGAQNGVGKCHEKLAGMSMTRKLTGIFTAKSDSW